jgi:hypothetical protein
MSTYEHCTFKKQIKCNVQYFAVQMDHSPYQKNSQIWKIHWHSWKERHIFCKMRTRICFYLAGKMKTSTGNGISKKTSTVKNGNGVKICAGCPATETIDFVGQWNLVKTWVTLGNGNTPSSLSAPSLIGEWPKCCM